MLTPASVEAQLKSLVDGWIGILDRAKEEKRAFNTVADQCVKFAGGKSNSGFMWKAAYKDKFLGKGISSPKFEVTLMKGFEYLSIFGPLLYWSYPHRKVASNREIQIDHTVLAGNDPQRQMYYEQLAGQQQQDDAHNDIRNKLYETVLNYCQREQYGGGLATHSRLSINEGLLKGRGCLWTEKYNYPGSGRTLVGSFFDPVANLLIDSDCIDPTLTTAKWISRKHMTPYWELEKKFNLPKHYLRDKGEYESGRKQGTKLAKAEKVTKVENDLVEWYEIFSKCGVGSRIDGEKTSLDEAWDEVVGDYAYLAVCKLCPFPLNAPASVLANEDVTDDEVEAMFEWPIPFWADDKWPVSVLDFFPDPESCWPTAPLAPALGELTCLNVLIACYLDLAYANKQQIIAFLNSAKEEVEAALKSTESIIYVGLNDAVHKSVNDIIQFMKRPETNNGLLQAIEFVLQRFEERTGLNEVMYGSQTKGAAARSAEDAKNRNDRASIRPDFMALVVADWQSDVSEKEKIALRFSVTAEDVAPLLGPLGSQAWSDLVEMEDPDVVFRGMKCTCMASDMRKPDKARETANIQNLVPQLMPIISQIAVGRGDYTQVNAIIQSLDDAMEQDLSKWMIPADQPDPEQQQQQQQLQQQMQQLEAEKIAAEADAKRAAAEQMRAGIQQTQFDFEGKQYESDQKLQLAAATGSHKMQLAAAMAQQKQQQAEHKLGIDSATAAQKLQLAEQQAAQKQQHAELSQALKVGQAGQQAQLAAAQAEQQARMATVQGAQQISVNATQAGDKRQQAAADFFQRLQQRAAEHQMNMAMQAQQPRVPRGDRE